MSTTELTAAPPSPTVGDLLYAEVEDELRSSVRALLDSRSSWHDVLVRTESSSPIDVALWRRLAAELDCAGLAVPDHLGGGGASWREVAVVAEELGRSVAPVPFLTSSIVTALLLELGDTELLPRVVVGDRLVALALPFETSPHATPAVTVIERDGRLHGSVEGVAGADSADAVLVLADEALYVVDSAAPGVLVSPVVSLDMTRPVSDVVLDGALGRELARGPHVAEAVHHALLIGATVLAAEQLGVAERCLAMAVDHLKLRRQFGRLIGSYQALKHRAADLWVLVSKARAVSRYAADSAALGSPDLPVAAALAQAYCSEVAQRVAEECLQLHGGIGFTWEHPVHLYLKRAKSAAIALGPPDRHRAAIAALCDIPQPEAGAS